MFFGIERDHRGLKHHFRRKVRGQHANSTGRKGRILGAPLKEVNLIGIPIKSNEHCILCLECFIHISIWYWTNNIISKGEKCLDEGKQ